MKKVEPFSQNSSLMSINSEEKFKEGLSSLNQVIAKAQKNESAPAVSLPRSKASDSAWMSARRLPEVDQKNVVAPTPTMLDGRHLATPTRNRR
jgi:hypothetical protein